MNNRLRKFTALALTAVMLFSMLPIDVLAALITTDYTQGVSLRSIIPTNPPVYTRTYTFEANGETVDTQIVKDGEYLTEPEVPRKTDHRFTGWYVGNEQLLFGPSNPISVTQTETIAAIARFEPVYYVFFMSSAGATASVYRTKAGVTGDLIPTGDVVLPIDSTQAVTGWYKNRALTDGPVGENYTVGTANQQLWPKIESGNYIYFVSGHQANYVAPKFVPPGAATQAPNVTMTRPGYTFSHWSLSDKGPAYTFGQTITGDITLYAVWTPVSTNYTVVFWKQSISDSKNAADSDKTYDFAGTSVVRQAITGTSVSPTSADMAMNYSGFHYNAAKSVSKIVNGDGTTILNVYYDRNLLTMVFQQGPSQYSSRFTTVATYTGLYGQSLAQNGYSFMNGYNWQEYMYGRYYTKVTFLDAFIYDDLNAESHTYPNDYLVLRSWSDETGLHYIYHYKQNLDGTYNYPDAPNNTNRSNYSYFTMTNKYVGFTVAYFYSTYYSTWQPTAPGKTEYYGLRDLHILHTRNAYTLSFYNVNAVDREVTVLFEQPLSSFVGYVPQSRPAGMPEGYTFEGWYKDEACTQPMDFATGKMGVGDLMVYAKWDPPHVHATVYQSMSAGAASTTHTLPYDEPIYQSLFPTVQDVYGHTLFVGDPNTVITVPANYRWVAWTTKENGVYTTFNFATKLTQDIELYPYYVSVQNYSVTYSPGAGTGTVVDYRTYLEGSYADVLPGTITPPAGQVFLGWKLSGDESGKIYVANDKIFIDGNKTLTAVFGPKLQARLTYKANGGQGNDVVYNLLNNQTHTIIENPSYTKAGYQFIGWNTAPMGVGLWYMPGVNVLVDGQDNVLYAQWEQLIIVTAQKGWNFLPPGSDRPDIWFTLYRKYADNSVVPVGTKKVESATVYWENQPYTNGYGFEYEYYVKETDASGADYVPPSFTKLEEGLTVTNTYQFVDFTVNKVWAGDHLPAVKPSITVQLQVSVAGGAFVDQGAPVLMTDGTTSYTWYDLPLEDSQRRSLSYRAVETVTPESYLVAYQHSATGTTITNTYQTTSYTAIKEWRDPNYLKPSGEAWPSIQLQLYQDGNAYGGYKFVPEQTEDSFSHTWTKLPALKANGTPHVYTAREVVVPPRYKMTLVDIAGQTTITNTLSRDSLTGTKYWVGEAPPAGASVTLQLYQTIRGENPTVHRVAWGEPVTITAANNWQHTWTGMPSVDDPANPTVDYEYEIAEAAAPAGYYYDTASSASLYVTNVSQTTSFTATKSWVDGINNRPQAVTLYLERSTDGVNWNRVTGTDYELTTADYNQHTWTGLTRFASWDADNINARVEYQYRVREEEVANYETTYPDNNTVKNKYLIPQRTITITKKWIGGPSADHVAPALHLWRRFTDNSVKELAPNEYTRAEEVTVDTGTTTNNKTYTYTYSGLSDTDADGNKYLYGFTEDQVAGYEMTLSNPYLLNGVWYALPGSVIENAYQVPKTVSLSATKLWVGGPQSDHQRVKLSIWRTTDDVENPVGPITMEEAEWFQATVTPMVGPSNTFTGFWPNLAQTDINGNPYTYFFIEDNEPTNYTRVYNRYIEVNGVQYAHNGATVTNTYTSPDTTVTAAKLWQNGIEADHTAVPLKLYRKIEGGTLGLVTGVSPIVSPASGTSGRFDYTWTVPQNDTDGNPYTYYFSEDEQANYTRTYSASETIDGILCAPNGAYVTNSYVSPKTSVTAVKTWVNGAQADHVAVPLTLYRKVENGALEEVTGKAYTLSPSTETASQFTYTWADLDQTDIYGNAYTYYFKEKEVTGYTRAYQSPYETDYGLAGTAVTNTYVQPTGEITGAKHWVDINPDTPVPTVYMKLYRSTNPVATEAEMEAVPDLGLITVDASTPKTQDEWYPEIYSSFFSWSNIHLNSLSGEPYYFFVKEVNAAGDPYVPANFEKYEYGTEIHNVYIAQGSFTPQVTKALAGRPLKADEFEFELVELWTPQGESEPWELQYEVVTNDADGNIIFSPLDYSSSHAGDSYHFLIREIVPEPAETGMAYDPLEIELTVNVAAIDAYDGVLAVTGTYSGDKTFNNTYTAAGSLPARTWATKELQGRALQAGEFSYELRLQGSTDVLQTRTNAADGSIVFGDNEDEIKFTQEDIGKSYIYTVNEVIPVSGESGMAYDPTILRFIVTVEDAGNGDLDITWAPERASSKFTNVFTPDPRALITKKASQTLWSAPGTVTYTYTVTNTGNVPLTNVAVADDKLGAVTLNKTTLGIGESATGTKTYNVTQADIDAGAQITNTATVTVSEAGLPETTVSETITFAQTPKAQVTKEADQRVWSSPGTVTYTYTVKNTGNVTLTDVKVADDKLGTVAENVTIGVGQTGTFTKTYNVTQLNIDAGTPITNKMTVTAAQNNFPTTETTETITFTLSPGVKIEKSADRATFADVGEEIEYTVKVTNTGNVTLPGVQIIDSLVDLETATPTESLNANGKLDVNEQWTYVYTYTVKQDDMNAGFITNSARIPNPDNPGGSPDDPVASHTLQGEQDIRATLTKVADPEVVDEPGLVTYTYTVTNPGNVTLTNIVLTDDLLGAVTLDKQDLDPGKAATGQLTHDVTQAEIDAGAAITNVATLTADQGIPETKDSATVTFDRTTALTVEKSANVSGFSQAGEAITYTVKVKNTGNVTLENVVVTDSLVPLVATMREESVDDNGKLDVGETWEYTYTYTVKQSDVDAGYVRNSVKVSHPDISDKVAELNITGTRTPLAEVSKTASPETLNKPGNVTYTYVVTNTGNVTLTNVKVADDKLGVVAENVTLDVGQSKTFTKTYSVTQMDIDAASMIKNIVTVTADQSIPETRAEETVTLTRTPGMKVTKKANKMNFTSVGETITYTVIVENTGNVTHENVVAEDSLTDLSKVTPVESLSANGKLDVGETWTYEYMYTVKQSDMNAGVIANSASASSTQVPEDDPGAPSADHDLPGVQVVSAAVKKEADQTVWAKPGRVTYTYKVKNTGNVTLTGVAVTDDILQSGVTLDSTDLLPGEIATGTLTYDVTQTDIDAGTPITNKATVTADQDIPTTEKTETITFTQHPFAVLTKEADQTVWRDPGTVTYTYKVTNTGNVTLTNIAVTDDLLGTVTLNKQNLEPGEFTTGTKTFDVTTAMIDAGVPITNIATLAAEQSIPLTQVSETITFIDAPNVEIIKYADQDEFIAPGTVTYTYQVRNTGNVTLTGASLSDNKLSSVNLGAGVTQLAPGQIVRITETYQVTQADIDAGTPITNVATFKCNELADQTATETITFVQTPKAQVTKEADQRVWSSPGTVTYTYTVKNTGNVTLTDVKVADDKLGTVAENVTIGVGQTGTFTKTYDVTQLNIDAGTPITNKMTVTAAQNNFPTTETTETITFTLSPGVKIEKSADRATFADVGEEIEYTVKVTNTGNVTLPGVQIIDSLVDLETATPTESLNANGKLDVNEQWTYVYTYTVKQDDMNAGFITNSVRIPNPDNPGGSPDDPVASHTLQGEQDIRATLTKAADPEVVDEPGLVTYTYTVTNPGNVTLTNIVLTDDLLGAVTLDKQDLDPGKAATGQLTYDVTQAEIDAGAAITNVATLTADQGIPETKDSATVTFDRTTALTVEKSAKVSGFSQAGEVITYTVKVKNTGNVTLENVVVTDSLVPLVATMREESVDDNGKLDVGETWEYTYTYTVKQSDVDAGYVRNSVKVSHPDISDKVAELNITGTRTPLAEVSKTASPETLNKPGNVTYTYVVTNTGNVTLTNVKVADDKLGVVAENVTLDVGQSKTFTKTYSVTQMDIDAAPMIKNIVTVTADQSIPETRAEETVTLTRTPGMKVTKKANKMNFTSVGETITYTVIVENTGNVTHENVVVEDSLTDLSKVTPVESLSANGKLDVGEKWTYEYTYTVKQSDMNAGVIANSASASSTQVPEDDPGAPSADHDLPGVQVVSAAVKKEADQTVWAKPGRVTYTYKVKNTGNVTLTGVAVTDDILQSGVTLDSTDLLPGEIATGTLTYDVTQTDIDAGAPITNKATVTADQDIPTTEKTETITFTQNSRLELSKKASRTTYRAVNEMIEYTVELSNTGNVSILNASITDTMANLTIGTYTHVAKDGTNTPVTYGTTANLQPGDKLVLKASYKISQNDLDNGFVRNVAAGSGYLPDSANPAQPDMTKPVTPVGSGEVTVNAEQYRLASVTKIANQKTFTKPGSVTYTYTVTNTGNVTLTDLKVHDDKMPLPGYVTLQGSTTLAPGERRTGTWIYNVTQEDIDAGADIKNIATVTADEGLPPTTQASEIIRFTQTPSATIEKTADKDQTSLPGLVTYTYTVTNTGNVTLTNVAVEDDKLGAVTLSKNKLAPNETATGKLMYDVIQEDIDKGADIENTATLTAEEIAPLTAVWTVTIAQNPKLSISKQRESINGDENQTTYSAAGDVVAYTVALENTGNVTIYNAEITDNMPGLTIISYMHEPAGGNAGPATNGETVLLPGDKLVMKSSYTVTQADLDRGYVRNSASGSGYTPDPENPALPDMNNPAYPASPSTVNVDADQNPSAEITKSADQEDWTAPGTVTYTYTVTNKGNVTLTNVAVNDNMLGAVTLDKTTIGVGESATGELTYQVTQDDIDQGAAIVNVATVTAKQNIPATNAEEKITFTQTPKASVTINANKTEWMAPGLVTYTYTVTNTGNVTLTNVAVDDDRLNDVPLLKTTLAVGESTTGKLTYYVTQADMDKGTPIKNEATVSAAQNIPEAKAIETITFKQSPQAEVSKGADRDIFARPGKVTYTYIVRNSGSVTLTNLEVNDDKLGPVTLNKTTLGIGEVAVGQLTYNVTQADIDKGTPIENVATVSAAQAIPETKTSKTITFTQTPGMAVSKRQVSVNGDTAQINAMAAGDRIAYEVVVTNTGNVTLTNVTVTDSLADLTLVTPAESKTADSKLEVGETWTYAYTYTVTQADMDAGEVKNSAAASGEAPNPDDPSDPKPVEPDAPDTVETPVTQTPGLTMSKTANPMTYHAAGDVITYTVEMRNTGNVTVLNAKITDTKAGLTGISYAHVAADGTQTGGVANGAVRLLPGEKLVMQAEYAVTQADLDAGSVLNSASGSGQTPDPGDPSNPDPNKPPVTPEEPGEVNVPATQTPGMAVSKRQVSVNGDTAQINAMAAGDKIAYEVVVTNAGNVTLTNVTVTDSLADLTLVTPAESKTADSKLEVGETWTYAYTYTVTQADMDAGEVKNSAAASGEAPNPDDPSDPKPVEPDAPDTVETPVTQTPGLTMSKTANPMTYHAAGDVITYTVEMKNTGNVTVFNAKITDTKAGLTGISYAHVAADGTQTGGVANGAVRLLPGEKLVMQAEYAVTQADLDAGSVLNSASGSGQTPDPGDPSNPDPNKPPVTPEEPGEVNVPATQTPGMAVSKRQVSVNGDTAQINAMAAGDKIAYEVVVTNAGNVTLTNVTVTDSLADLTLVTPAESKTADSKLEVGETWTYAYTYTVTQADMDAGEVKNSAAASGEVPNPDDPSDPKPVEPDAPDTVETPVTQSPGLTMSKTANPMMYHVAGDVITYTVEMKNTGNVTVFNAKITDTKAGLTGISYAHVAADGTQTGGVANGAVRLLPGEKLVMQAEYAVTQADLDAGSVLNSASGSGQTPDPGDPSNPDPNKPPVTPEEPGEVNVPATQTPGMAVSKRQVSVNGDTAQINAMAAGDKIAYEVVVTNTGNVTLTNVTVTDSLADLTLVTPAESKTADSKLEVGETWTYAYTYTVTQADMDAGEVKNSAAASGEAPNPDDPSDPKPVEPDAPDTVETPVTQTPGLTMSKTANPMTYHAAGDVITYTVEMKNTGNVTVFNAKITDTKAGLTGISYAHVAADGTQTGGVANGAVRLLPGEKLVMQAEYAVTQADLDAGSVLNSASGSGQTPDPGDPSNPDPNKPPVTPEEPGEVNVPATQTPELTMSKTANPMTYKAAGDVITYTVEMKNTGNVTVFNAEITDTKAGLTNISYAHVAANGTQTGGVANGAVRLLPGEKLVMQAEYAVTQADLDAGSVLNSASGSGQTPDPGDPLSPDPNKPPVTPEKPGEVEVPATQTPGMTVTKSSDKTKFTAVGEAIRYEVVITNTGNVTLEDVVVTDSLTTLTDALRTETKAADGKLEVDETWTYVYTYIVTRADMEAGYVKNVAKATSPDLPDDPGNPVEDEVVVHKPAYTVVKEAAEDRFRSAGDILNYTVTVTNTGQVIVEDLIISDTLVSFSDMTLVESVESNGHLDVGEVWKLTYSYAVTEADVAAGMILNRVSATDPDDPDNPQESEHETPKGNNPSLIVLKTVTEEDYNEEGDQLSYTITVTNNGDIALSGIELEDSLADLSDVTPVKSINDDDVLDVGETWTYIYAYSVTDGDMLAGNVLNIVSVSSEQAPSVTDEVDVPRGPAPPASSVTTINVGDCYE